MTTQKDAIDIADALSNDIGYMQTLLWAAQDKVHFYLSNKSLLGDCDKLLSFQARELGGLLDLAGQFLGKMEQEMKNVTDLLYSIEPPPVA